MPATAPGCGSGSFRWCGERLTDSRSSGHDAVVPRYEILDHTADTGIIAFGSTLHELFEHAGYGMFALMFAPIDGPARRDVPIVAAGDSAEDLLVGWLQELLFQSEVVGVAFDFFTVDRLEEGGVQGAAGGTSVATAELVGPPIKAVTYPDLAVVRIPDGWWARVIFDV